MATPSHPGIATTGTNKRATIIIIAIKHNQNKSEKRHHTGTI